MTYMTGRNISVSNSKFFFFQEVGRIHTVQAEFFKNLTPIQQKGRRVPTTVQDKVDHKLINKGT